MSWFWGGIVLKSHLGVAFSGKHPRPFIPFARTTLGWASGSLCGPQNAVKTLVKASNLEVAMQTTAVAVVLV